MVSGATRNSRKQPTIIKLIKEVDLEIRINHCDVMQFTGIPNCHIFLGGFFPAYRQVRQDRPTESIVQQAIRVHMLYW